MRRPAAAAWALALLSGCVAGSVVVSPGGVMEGNEVKVFTLTNRHGLIARLTEYGALLMELHVPDLYGRLDDVVLGFDTPERYAKGNPFFGCTAGRVANRIAGSRFTLDGKEHVLPANDGPHQLHGGPQGFDKKLWKGEGGTGPDGPFVRFSRLSPDGEEGYPGNLDVSVTYRLTNDDELRIEMTATTDRPTLVNLAHHTYWNLGGHDSGDVLAHELALAASRYTPADAALIPTGVIAPVAGTPFDFTRPKRVGKDIVRTGLSGPGYDHNFAVDAADGALRRVALLRDPRSGRTMELLSGEPGVQLYTGNFLDGTLKGKKGALYPRHAGLCLETQKFPDAVHHPAWVQPVLRPGEIYRHVMVHRFRTE
jgi:aldose 1-epimerase